MTREIPLTQGYVALVDDCEYERCARHNWCAAVAPNTVYGVRGFYVDGKYVRIFLHRFILGLPDGVPVDHVNGDGLNNTYANLRAASHRQNVWNSRKATGRLVGVTRGGIGRSHRAAIGRDGGMTLLGSFATGQEAARVYDAAAIRLRGAFAVTNYPDIDPEADAIAAHVLAGGSPPEFRPDMILTADAVRDIRRRYAAGGVFFRELAAEHGTCLATISHLMRGLSWQSVTADDGLQDEIDAVAQKQRGRSGEASSRRKLTQSQVDEIRRRYRPRVVTARALADEFGVSPASIASIVGGYSWKAEAA